MPKKITDDDVDPIVTHQEEELEELRGRMAVVQQLQRDYAGPIIAAGVLSGDEIWTNLLGMLTCDGAPVSRTRPTTARSASCGGE